MSQLEDLLQQCTVKLSLSDRVGWGTGFFVAPGWILTCAHVIQAAQGQPIQVRWQNQENWAEAVVERSIPDPYDLALLRVTLPTDANPPCVILGEEVCSRDPLYLFGYPDEDFPNGCPVTVACEGLTGDTPPLIKFALGQVRPGMSGAPLLNQRTSEVCGLVKFTRDRSFDLGGGAIPAAIISEQFPKLRQLQQQFHQLDQRWSNLLPTATNQSKILDDQKVHQYLDYLSRSEWWNSYRLTEAISTQQATFTFEQMVQTEEQSQENPAQKEKRVWALLEGIIQYAKSEPVLLVGAPGLGKSTTLLRLLVVLAKQELRNANPRIPVLIKLKDYANSAREAGDSSGILALIQEALKPDLFLEITDIETLLFQENRFILLLDGLNEIPANVLQNKLTTFRRQCDRARVPLVCTTRNLGFDLGIQRKLQLQTIEPSEIQRFLQHCMPGQKQQILNLLNKSNPELGKTPFVLWMLYDVFKKSGEIPESIGEAFRKFKRSYTNYKLNQEGIPISEEMIDSWNLWLEYLAFELLRSPDPHDPGLIISEGQAANLLTQFPSTPALDLKQAQAEIKNLLKYHLLQKTDKDEISFCHQLIQEYYAAEFLLRQLPTLINEPLKLKREYINYLKWTEPIALMLTLHIDESQALRIVNFALDIDLFLAAQLAGAVPPKSQKQAISSVMERFTTVIPEQPDWLKLKLLKTIGSKAVGDHLISLLNHADYSIGNYAYFSLLEIAPEVIPQEGKHQEDIRRVQQLLQSSSQSQDEENLPVLRPQILKKLSPNVRFIFDRWTTKTMSSDEVVAELAPMLHSNDWRVQWSIVQVLGCLKTQSIVPILLQAIEDSTSLVVHAAAVELGKLKLKSVIPRLIEIAEHHPHVSVRHNIVYALQMIGSEEAIPGIIQAAQDSDEWVRHAAAEAFNHFDFEVIVPGLITVLSHFDPHVRRLAAHRLRILSNKDSIAKLLNERFLQILVQALEHSDLWVRWRIAFTLWNIATENLIPILYPKLNDDEFDISLCAALVLGKLGCEDTTPKLVQMLSANNLIGHPDIHDIFHLAAYALGQIESSASAQHLPELLTLVPTRSGEDALRAIIAIQKQCKFYKYEIAKGFIPSGKSISLFFSYAPNDEVLQNELAKHLKMLERQGVITSWDSRKILPGEEREQVINDRLNTAHIILLLISSDSMADDHCYEVEIRRAISRHQAGEAHVIPILLRPVNLTGELFGNIPVLPQNGLAVTLWDNQDEAFRAIAAEIQEAAIKISTTKR